MKRTALTVFASIFCIVFILAQTPQSFNYQTLLRSSEGTVISEKIVDLKFSIIQGTPSGELVYSEIHNTTSNSVGLISLKIGEGTEETGTFSAIDWSLGQYFLKVELDLLEGNGYVDIGTSQLLSVPFAFHAETVTNIDDADADSENELQDISLEGTELSISEGATIDLSILQDGVEDDDSDATNEIQSLSIEGDSLAISDGNKVKMPSGTSNWESSGNDIYYNSGKVGIGTSTPANKFVIKGDESTISDEVLFAVVNNTNDTVFAVFQGGVRINVEDNANKATGNKAGFAVGGFSSNKTLTNDYLHISPDSVRIYVDDNSAKATGNKGGFAVGGFSSNKGTITNEYLRVTRDSTRIYIDDSDAKATGNKGGFAVGGFSSSKADVSNFLDLTPDNYFIGHEAGSSVTTGLYNSFFGYQAGKSNTEGNQSIFIGYKAGSLNTVGDNNTFIGNYAGYENTSGYENVYIGDSAGANSTSAFWNVFIGEKAGLSNTSGYSNTFIGEETGLANTTGRMNAFIGTGCGFSNTTAYKNTFIGSYCGLYNTEGIANVFIGSTAGINNTTGGRNVYIGQAAGYSITESSYNVMIGNQSGAYATGGDNNVFLGTNSGHKNKTGNDNVFLGTNVGMNNTDADRNTVLGAYAADSDTLGDENVILGYQTGQFSRGAYNIMLGSRAGQVSTGYFNIMIGQSAGRATTNASQNIFIGRSAGWYEQNSDRLIIETTEAGENGALIYGEFDVDYLRFNARVGIGTRSESDANLVINDSSGLATQRIRGVGDTYNYSRIVLESNEGTNKFWQLAHTKDNGYSLVYHDGSIFNSRFKIFAEGGARLYYGDLQVDNTITANKIQSNGGFIAGLNSITEDYTVLEDDYTILAATSSLDIIITLPSASLVANQIYIVKKIDANANAVIIEPEGSEMIDSSANYSLSNQNDAITFQSNGTDWYIIGKLN